EVRGFPGCSDGTAEDWQRGLPARRPARQHDHHRDRSIPVQRPLWPTGCRYRDDGRPAAHCRQGGRLTVSSAMTTGRPGAPESSPPTHRPRGRWTRVSLMVPAAVLFLPFLAVVLGRGFTISLYGENLL